MDIGSSIQAQEHLLTALKITAGLDGIALAPQDPRWSLVWRAGVYEIGRQCDQYLDALFRFNREQRAVRQGLTAVGATTAAIMGITGAAGSAIAATAAAFGLSATLFDAGVSSVLFTIEPSALRSVALKGREDYLKSIAPDGISTRPDTLIALQGYLAQCSPAAIEANINNAASGAPSVASSDPRTSMDAARLAAPGSTLLQRVQQQVISDVHAPLPEGPKVPVSQPDTTRFEHLTRTQITQIQDALCVTPADGKLGGLPGSNAPTRVAIRNFLSGRMRATTSPGELATEKADELRPSPDLELIYAAVDDAFHGGSVRKCSDPSRNFANAFEVGLYGNLKPDQKAEEIRALQGQLRKVLGSDPGVPDTGELDGATRQAIGLARTKMGIAGPDRQLDYALYTRLQAIP